jgi:hypothetical protein
MQYPATRLLALGILVSLALLALHPRSATVLAISYPSGWNLVSGTERSTLSGATGTLYTLQQGDTHIDSSRPPPRKDALLTFDAVHQQVVMFGGDGKYFDPRNDTWVWDGSTWEEQHPVTSPSWRAGGGMAFDAARGNIVLFGFGIGNAPDYSVFPDVDVGW